MIRWTLWHSHLCIAHDSGIAIDGVCTAASCWWADSSDCGWTFVIVIAIIIIIVAIIELIIIHGFQWWDFILTPPGYNYYTHFVVWFVQIHIVPIYFTSHQLSHQRYSPRNCFRSIRKGLHTICMYGFVWWLLIIDHCGLCRILYQ